MSNWQFKSGKPKPKWKSYNSRFSFSSNGFVYDWQTKAPAKLKTTLNGHLFVIDTNGTVLYVHRIVFQLFKVWPNRCVIPDGKVIDHIDGNKQNNSIENLQCITQSQNIIKSRH